MKATNFLSLNKILQLIYKLFIVAGLRVSYRNGVIRHDDSITVYKNLNFQKSLDIGSGPNPQNLFEAQDVFGVDIRCGENKNVVQCNLALEKIPFENSTFDCVTAIDVLEHIPRVVIANNDSVFPFVNLMNEIWRVLKEEGVFYSRTPAFPMKGAFQDPTHVNIITEDTLNLYFCEKAWARIYGFYGSFVLIDEGWVGEHYWCIMKKSSGVECKNLNFVQK